jgi:hypothetical protein
MFLEHIWIYVDQVLQEPIFESHIYLILPLKKLDIVKIVRWNKWFLIMQQGKNCNCILGQEHTIFTF